MATNFSSRLSAMQNWQAPNDFKKITVIDAHTGGEPLRIIVDGLPEIKGKTILERRRYLKEHLDYLRTAIMWEPRGHADMYGCIITEPVTPDADFGVLFLHNEGYSTMCGHGIIAVTKVAIEMGLVQVTVPQTTVKIDTPAGLVTATGYLDNGKVAHVSFQNVPAYVVALDKTVQVSGLGEVTFDIAFGGAYYAFVKAASVGLSMTGEHYRQLIEKGMAIKNAVMKSFHFEHPFQSDLSFLYGTIFIGPGITSSTDSRNVCIFADGEVDRSPTGTGVSARMALHYAKGELQLGEKMVIESIVGSQFVCSIKALTTFGAYQAVIPEVQGTAHICGINQLLIDPTDPHQHGFFFR